MSQLFNKIYNFSSERKSYARSLVSRAVAKREIIIPASCESCFYTIAMINEEESMLSIKNTSARSKRCLLEAHHYNYNFPLLVWWLCPTCHKMIHIIQRKLGLACLHISEVRRLINEYRYDYEHSWIDEIDENYGRFEELYF